MDIQRFNDIIPHLRRRGDRRTVVVVWAADASTRSAVAQVLQLGVADVIFVGCRDAVEADAALHPYTDRIRIIDAADGDAAAAKAVELINAHEAQVLMKGLINTDNLLRAVLNKEHGILRPGEVLTHISVAEIPQYHKLLVFTDAAVIPYPTDQQREAQVRYALAVARGLNVQTPKAVMVHCTEKVDPRHFPFTANYQELKQKAAEGAFGDCVLDGPLDIKTALSAEALKKKGIESPVGGDADVLIFPDIIAANSFYKTLTLFGEANIAGMLAGTAAPVVVSSRGDSVQSKYLSLLLALT